MKKILTFFTLAIFAMSCKNSNDNQVVLVTLDPGHFHAALVQKTQYPQVSKDVYVYAPDGAELEEHLKKIDGYNTRAENPTAWNEVIYRGEDYLEKMLSEKKGNVMVTAGNNSKKTEYIKKTLEAGINVLADKPMAINVNNYEMLKECFEIAQKNDVLLYDIMTERFEISTILQRELSMIPSIYGEQEMGTEDNPAITKESVHHFYKIVSGSPLTRPDWFYDVEQQGEGIADVMVHLVDLVQWECFPEQILNTDDVEITSARHWSTPVNPAQFKSSTGLDEYPEFLQKDVKDGVLHVNANGEINYKLKGVSAKVVVLWDFEPPVGGGDTHYSIMRGSKANLVIRQGAEQNFTPELYIEPVGEVDAAYVAEVQNAFKALADKYPGIELTPAENGWQVVIPGSYRVGHEAHFGQVTENYLRYLEEGALPEWEVPNMITKYYTTTSAWKMVQ